MLQLLKIKNVALIKELEINFQQGFNVLLGSTGAGKSIIFDALNFVLGGKADKTLIRTGESMMKVEAVFSSLSSETCAYFVDAGLLEEGENEMLLSRSLSEDGKSVIRINGSPATAQMLKECGSALADSYSQHESISLLKSKNHLAMLDKLGGNKMQEVKDYLIKEYEEYQSILKQIASLGGDEFERERTKSLLEYQIKEIEKAQLSVGEDEDIKQKIALMSSAEKIFDAVKTCEELLEGSAMSAISSVHEAGNALSALSNVEEIDRCRERLNSCKYELEDISDTLKDIRERTTFDQRELDCLDARQDLIKLLCKKYGGSVERVLQYSEKAKASLANLENSEFELERLNKLKSMQEDKCKTLCEKLSDFRKEIAHDTEKKLMSELKQLGMKNTTFVIEFTRLENFTANGFDGVEFAFSANIGQEVKALSKTASGGEMSRVMLAFKTIFASAGLAQTLIFDEIDTGISGEVGFIVGEKLSSLGEQVLCITHLAQVACQGDAFLYVNKFTDNGATFTEIKELTGEDIDIALAKLISGEEVTESALRHIKEMRTDRASKR